MWDRTVDDLEAGRVLPAVGMLDTCRGFHFGGIARRVGDRVERLEVDYTVTRMRRNEGGSPRTFPVGAKVDDATFCLKDGVADLKPQHSDLLQSPQRIQRFQI